MNIVLIGYGKMGKTIEGIALKRGHSIIAKLNSPLDTDTFFANYNFDVTPAIAIDFTEPSMALSNINLCVAHRLPLVIGTTGWYAHLEEVKGLVYSKNGSLFYASNFSLGVYLFNKAAVALAKIMNAHSDSYEIGITEVHHTQKLDAPSGTAISLAEAVLPVLTDFNSWHLKKGDDSLSAEHSLAITAIREENVPGTHELIFNSAVDCIKLQHLAHNREGFALGAVVAAEFLMGKQGVFSMSDLLD